MTSKRSQKSEDDRFDFNSDTRLVLIGLTIMRAPSGVKENGLLALVSLAIMNVANIIYEGSNLTCSLSMKKQ